MVTVAELGRVSVPPGPKLTVAVGLYTAFDTVAVTFWVMIMVDGGFAPFFLAPPRDACGFAGVAVTEQMNCVPAIPFTVTDVPAAQDPTPPLSIVTLGGLGALIVNPFGVNRVTTTLGAGVVVVLLMVQVMFPAWPTLGLGF